MQGYRLADAEEGDLLQETPDALAEWFSVEELLAEEWFPLEDYKTRAAADAALFSMLQLKYTILISDLHN